MFGFGNNQPQQQMPSTMLNLSQTGAPTGMISQQNMGMGMGMGGQQPGQTLMGGMFAGAGYGDQYNQYYNQPVAPPSETEILDSMLKTLIPIDKFIVSPQMPAMMEMLSSIISMSVLNILKNATFAIDEDDGSMTLDVTSLPQDLQTLSVENVMAQLSTMQNTSNQAIQNAEMQRQQVLTMANQSMMAGALNAAMANPGLMENVGTGIGSFTRNLLTGGR